MKRWLSILLTTFYLLFALGLNVQIHFCKGEVKWAELFPFQNTKSCCEKSKQTKGCCEQTSFEFILDVDQRPCSVSKTTAAKQISIFQASSIGTFESKVRKSESAVFEFESPPTASSYIKNCALLFYG